MTLWQLAESWSDAQIERGMGLENRMKNKGSKKTAEVKKEKCGWCGKLVKKLSSKGLCVECSGWDF